MSTIEARSAGDRPRYGFAEIAVLVLLAITPLIYLKGVTFEFTYLKLPVFQVATVICLMAMAAFVVPGEWLRGRIVLIGPAAALLAWMLLSLAWHHHRWAAPAALMREASFFLGFIGLSFLLSSAHTRKLFARWLFVAAVVSALAMLYYLSHGHPNYFGNRNLAGGFLVLPIVAAVAYLVGPSERISSAKYWGLVAALVLMAYALLMTASRGEMPESLGGWRWMYDFALKLANGAAAGVIAGLFVMVCALYAGPRRYLLVGAGAVVLAALVVLTARPELLKSALGIRRYLWQGAMNMIGSSPVLGQGIGGYAAAVRAFQPMEYYMQPAAAASTLHPHCYPLEVMAELGIGGILLYAGLLAGLFLATLKAARNAADEVERAIIIGIAAGLAGMVVNSLVSITATEPGTQISFWLGAAFICGAMASPGAAAVPAGGSLSPAGQPLVRRIAFIVVGAAAAMFFFYPGAKAITAQRMFAVARRTPDPAKRLAMLQRVKALQPWHEESLSTSIRMRLAAEYYLRNKVNLALSEYMELERLSPDYQGIDSSIAHARLTMKDFAGAAEYAERALRSNPFDGTTYQIWLAALDGGATSPPATRAIELLDTARTMKHTVDPVLTALAAGFQKRAGNAAKSAELYRESSNQCAAIVDAVAKAPGDTTAVALRMFAIWMEIGSEADDVEVFRQAVKSMESTLAIKRKMSGQLAFEFTYLLGALKFKAGEKENARQLLTQVADNCKKLRRPGKPEDIPVLTMLMRVYALLDPNQSAEYAKLILQQDPANATARQVLMSLQAQKK